tara:strand:- start:2780 stop:3055 length:276 start_codon:yes stop_codon:yes gene_type:complete
MKKIKNDFEDCYDININYLELLDFIISKQLEVELKKGEISKKLKESEFLSDGQCVELQLEKIKLKSKFDSFEEIMVKLIKIIKKNEVVNKF